MNNIIINKDGEFKSGNVNSIPLDFNNFKINNDINLDLKKDEISNNIKPMLTGDTITIPEGKKYKVKPNFNKKVPLNTFSMIANNKKNVNNSESDDSSNSSGSSNQSMTDEILTGSNKYTHSQTSISDESDDDDNYSSIDSGVKSKNMTQTSNGTSEYDEDDDDDDTEYTEEPVKKKSYEEIQQEKQQLLFNLDRLQKQGYPPSKRYTMASSFEDIKYEHDRLKKQRDVEKSIRFSRKILVGFCSGVEWLNNKFDYFDAKLDKWSENVMENISDYDEVFEELHDKYSSSVSMAPELRLISMVAGSAFMYHLTNSFFKQSSPNLKDILKQNPDIMKNIQEAAAKNMGNSINQSFGEDDFVGNMMKDGINAKINQQIPRNFEPPRPMPSMNNLSQTRMKGPPEIDEIIKELNEENGSVGSNGSLNIRNNAKRTTATPNKKGGIRLDLR